ncbi:hypothetical protein ACH4VT_13995 [Streptomyces lydicus]|uniref:hypothetical protein n=1 Tax=Streptomyces lydicus TaxID=47763 RepID=UPI0037A21235
MTFRSDMPSAGGRLRTAWAAAHQPVAGVPRWARRAAHAVPWIVLPSGLWRIAAVCAGDDHGRRAGDLPSWLPAGVYVVLLSVLCELLAFSTVGLVASWGEVFPRWVPALRGRRVPTAAAVVPAALGATALTALWTVLGVVTEVAGVTLRGAPLPVDYPGAQGGWSAVVFHLCYAPLLLWGPLLAAVTVAYGRRRRTAVSPVACPVPPWCG